MMFARRILISFLVVALPTASFAQNVDKEVGAEALFREGKRLMKDKKYAEACDKFEASDRLDESVGTLLNLADCREKNDQLATAWATFLKAVSVARTRSDARETEARNRAHVLEPRLAYLTISVPEGSRVEGLAISRDGTPIDPALWNQGLPVDVGSYQISGQAPGHEPWSTRVDIRADGQRSSIEVPRFKQLKDLTAAVVKPEPKPAEPAPAEEPEHDAPAQPGMLTTTREIAIGVAAVGVVGAIAGTRYALTARDLDRQSNAICPGIQCGDPRGLELNRSARSDLLASEILFGVAGAAIAGGAVLWFVGAPHAHATVALAPVVTSTQVGLAIGGGF